MESRTDRQEQIDNSSVSAIEVRAAQRATAGQDADPETDRQMARADAHDLRRIFNPALQESAALQMAGNIRAYGGYRTGLDDVAPGDLGMAARIGALAAAHAEKLQAREVVQAADRMPMCAEHDAGVTTLSPEAGIDPAAPEVALPARGRNSAQVHEVVARNAAR